MLLEHSPSPACERPNILIVEDEEGPRESLRLILKSKYNIFTGQNGHEALQILENTPIDLITLDLKLPGTPGHELLQDFKRLQPEVEILIVSGYGTFESAVAGIRHGVSEFITKPFNVMEVMACVHRLLEKAQQRKAILRFLQNLPNLSNPDLGRDPAKVPPMCFPPTRSSEKETNILEFARVLAATLDAQDPYTHGHSERVAHYTVSIAEDFGFTPQESNDLMIAAYLHDIGKIGLSREILSKQSMLSAEERRILRTHPEIGVQIVEPLGLSSMARSVIRHHHERWDGSGYPDRLIGDQIPLAARIVCVADSYDAMTSDRPYRRAFSRDKTIHELREERFKRYDGDVVEAFLDHFKSYV